MFSPLVPWQYEITLRIFASVYILWGAMWGLVAYHYGRASQTSWREQGGTWKRSFSDFFRVYLFAWQKFLCGIHLIKSPEICEDEVPTRYTIGHHLRFSILLGAITPLFLTTTLAETDRHEWNFITFCIIIVLLMISSMGAAGHLFIAYRMSPKSWTRVVVAATVWLIAGPIFLIKINWP